MAAKDRTPAERRLEIARQIVTRLGKLPPLEQRRVLDAVREMIDVPTTERVVDA